MIFLRIIFVRKLYYNIDKINKQLTFIILILKIVIYIRSCQFKVCTTIYYMEESNFFILVFYFKIIFLNNKKYFFKLKRNYFS